MFARRFARHSTQPTPRRPRLAARALPWLGAGLGLMWALLIFAPALWLAGAVEAASAGRVRLLDVDGSVWAGSGIVALAPHGQDNRQTAWRALPQRLHWHWRWQLRQPLAVTLELRAAAGVNLRLRVGVNMADLGPKRLLDQSASKGMGALLALEMAALDAAQPALHVPLTVLDGLGAPWNTLALRGALLAHIPEPLSWRDAATAGRLQLDLTGVGTALAPRPSVGSWSVDIVPTGAVATLALSTVRGPLHMQGSGRIDATGSHFAGRAWVNDAERDADLANLLTLLGEREDAASVRLRIGSP